jgi:hypothetical protein
MMNIAEYSRSCYQKEGETTQAEAENMNKLNASPSETEDSNSSNQSSYVTAVVVMEESAVAEEEQRVDQFYGKEETHSE